jgi:hypothetical protein
MQSSTILNYSAIRLVELHWEKMWNPYYEICNCTTKSMVYPYCFHTISILWKVYNYYGQPKSILFPIKVHTISILWPTMDFQIFFQCSRPILDGYSVNSSRTWADSQFDAYIDYDWADRLACMGIFGQLIETTCHKFEKLLLLFLLIILQKLLKTRIFLYIEDF